MRAQRRLSGLPKAAFKEQVFTRGDMCLADVFVVVIAPFVPPSGFLSYTFIVLYFMSIFRYDCYSPVLFSPEFPHLVPAADAAFSSYLFTTLYFQHFHQILKKAATTLSLAPHPATTSFLFHHTSCSFITFFSLQRPLNHHILTISLSS